MQRDVAMGVDQSGQDELAGRVNDRVVGVSGRIAPDIRPTRLILFPSTVIRVFGIVS
jgi:hypothetical protein